MADNAKWLGLLKWSMKYQDGTHESDFTEMSQEKKEFLEKVMKDGIMDENERIQQILRICDGEHPSVVFAKEGDDDEDTAQPEPEVTAEELAEYKDSLLDELLTRIDQIDLAQNFCKMKGLVTMIKLIKENDRASTRALAAEVCSVVVQNNPFCQNAAVDVDLLEVLCALAADPDATCRVKALLAISCLVRHHPLAEQRFLSPTCDGLAILQTYLQSTDDLRLQRKALFFMRYLVRNSKQTAERVLKDGEFVRIVSTFIANEDVDLCEGSLEALTELFNHGNEFATALRTPQLALLPKLAQRKAQIEQLTGEDREYASEIHNMVTHLQELLQGFLD